MLFMLPLKSFISEKAKSIRNCPFCGAKVEPLLEGDYYCPSCKWNSAAAYIAAGSWDELFRNLDCDEAEKIAEELRWAEEVSKTSIIKNRI